MVQKIHILLLTMGREIERETPQSINQPGVLAAVAVAWHEKEEEKVDREMDAPRTSRKVIELH